MRLKFVEQKLKQLAPHLDIDELYNTHEEQKSNEEETMLVDDECTTNSNDQSPIHISSGNPNDDSNLLILDDDSTNNLEITSITDNPLDTQNEMPTSPPNLMIYDNFNDDTTTNVPTLVDASILDAAYMESVSQFYPSTTALSCECCSGKICKHHEHELRPSHKCNKCNKIVHILCGNIDNSTDDVTCYLCVSIAIENSMNAVVSLFNRNKNIYGHDSSVRNANDDNWTNITAPSTSAISNTNSTTSVLLSSRSNICISPSTSQHSNEDITTISSAW